MHFGDKTDGFDSGTGRPIGGHEPYRAQRVVWIMCCEQHEIRALARSGHGA
jgi:hypothetical protein